VQVLQQKAGKWLIASFQNTNAVPEQPFPTGPPIDQPAHASISTLNINAKLPESNLQTISEKTRSAVGLMIWQSCIQLRKRSL
jgi:hypothetical protein